MSYEDNLETFKANHRVVVQANDGYFLSVYRFQIVNQDNKPVIHGGSDLCDRSIHYFDILDDLGNEVIWTHTIDGQSGIMKSELEKAILEGFIDYSHDAIEQGL